MQDSKCKSNNSPDMQPANITGGKQLRLVWISSKTSTSGTVLQPPIFVPPLWFVCLYPSLGSASTAWLQGILHFQVVKQELASWGSSISEGTSQEIFSCLCLARFINQRHHLSWTPRIMTSLNSRVCYKVGTFTSLVKTLAYSNHYSLECSNLFLLIKLLHFSGFQFFTLKLCYSFCFLVMRDLAWCLDLVFYSIILF